MKKIYKAALILTGIIGWWGFVYPDLCLTEDVYQVYEDEPVMEQNHILDLEKPELIIDGVCIKSRIAEYVYQGRLRTEKRQKSEK